jgi:hypothetical protein
MLSEDGGGFSMIRENRYEVPREQQQKQPPVVKKINCVRDLGVMWSCLCWLTLAGVALMIFFLVFDNDNGGGSGGSDGDKQQELWSQLFSP